jgi:hypothetical protein
MKKYEKKNHESQLIIESLLQLINQDVKIV